MFPVSDEHVLQFTTGFTRPVYGPMKPENRITLRSRKPWFDSMTSSTGCTLRSISNEMNCSIRSQNQRDRRFSLARSSAIATRNTTAMVRHRWETPTVATDSDSDTKNTGIATEANVSSMIWNVEPPRSKTVSATPKQNCRRLAQSVRLRMESTYLNPTRRTSTWLPTTAVWYDLFIRLCWNPILQTQSGMKQPGDEDCISNERHIRIPMVIVCMGTLRGLYRQLDDRVRGLSRGSYALLVGLVSAVGVFAVRLLLPGDGSFGPVMMGITMAVVYYAFDPNNANWCDLLLYWATKEGDLSTTENFNRAVECIPAFRELRGVPSDSSSSQVIRLLNKPE